MNKVILTGRLVKDPDVRFDVGPNKISIANYTLAVRRPFAKEGQQESDFIRCKAFGSSARFANDYLCKGIKVEVWGSLQSRAYDTEDGRRVFVTEVLVEGQEFAESASANRRIAGNHEQEGDATGNGVPAAPAMPAAPAGGAYNPESAHDFGDAELPFS